jgi:hypothetical protein
MLITHGMHRKLWIIIINIFGRPISKLWWLPRVYQGIVHKFIYIKPKLPQAGFMGINNKDITTILLPKTEMTTNAKFTTVAKACIRFFCTCFVTMFTWQLEYDDTVIPSDRYKHFKVDHTNITRKSTVAST